MIFDKFGADFKIYSEMIEQTFERPCFFIGHDNGKVKRQLGSERLFYFKCHIFFYPQNDGNANKEMLKAAFKLFDGCENITSCGKRLKYLGGEYVTEADRLIFDANFKAKISKSEEAALMDKLFLENELKQNKKLS